jgi:COMPASS component SPP1
MNISSLLCTDDGPSPSPTTPPTHRRPSPPGPDPVILAPHLRGHHYQHATGSSSSSSSSSISEPDHLPLSLQPHLRKRSYSPDPRKVDDGDSQRGFAYPLIAYHSRPSSLSPTHYSPPFATTPYSRPPIPSPTQLHSTTPYTFPPVQAQPSSVRSNPPPPFPSAFNGLEALVHAATQEQKRLGRSDTDRRSPVLDRGYPPPRPHHADERRQIVYHETDSRPKRGTGMLVPVDEMHAQLHSRPPPVKRQRLSDPSLPAYQPMRLSGPGAHAYPVNDRAVLGMESGKEEPLRTLSGTAGDRGKKNASPRPQTPAEPINPKPTKEHPQTKDPAQTKDQQDAHEWLLEHYAGSPTISTVPAMARVRGRPSSAPSRVTPEVELELEEAVLAAAPPPAPRPTTAGSMRDEPEDPDVVLDLVAESIDAEDGAKSSGSRISMEVDDELLSLVDDSPHPPPPTPSAPTPPIQRYPFAAPPPSLRLSKPLTPTMVTVSSALVSPAPISPYPLTATSERGSMPPPPTTNVGGKGGKKSAEAKGKKAATKVRVFFWCELLNLTVYSKAETSCQVTSKGRYKV